MVEVYYFHPHTIARILTLEQAMKILMTGGTGFIGSTLLPRLHAGGHEVTVLSRRPGNVPTPAQGIETLDVLPEDAGFDVVINLAGEPIADKRWSAAQKRRITDSRLDTTRRLIDYFAKCTQKPGVFISASAIGYYGVSRTEAEVDEDARGDDSFSSQLCRYFAQTKNACDLHWKNQTWNHEHQCDTVADPQ